MKTLISLFGFKNLIVVVRCWEERLVQFHLTLLMTLHYKPTSGRPSGEWIFGNFSLNRLELSQMMFLVGEKGHSKNKNSMVCIFLKLQS